MPNGKTVLNELEFEKRIGSMGERQLLEFVARQNYETCLRCIEHDNRIKNLEDGDKRISGISGGISGTIAGAIVGAINFFLNKG